MKKLKLLGVACGGIIVVAGAGVAAVATDLVELDIVNKRPHFVAGEIDVKHYDGIADDLLTAGLGMQGLLDPKAPPYYDNFSPRIDDLRKNTIYINYRSMYEATEAGGFGRLLGPNMGASGRPDGTDGTVPGTEYIAYEDDGTGTLNVTMMVQVPDDFDPNKPCIVTGPSSGSRGVYGAIGISGQWGLKRGCAVAYTDKGTGTGVHDLHEDAVYTMLGKRMSRRAAGDQSTFSAPGADQKLAEFNRKWPHRLAFKHPHSERNAEAQWGHHVLASIEFAFYLLNERYGIKVPGLDLTFKTITPDNTTVVALGLSNGGGAAIRAAELDSKGLIDGVIAAEPTLQLGESGDYAIRQGQQSFAVHSKSLLDYTTFQSLYQACASTAPENAGAPFNLLPEFLGHARCAALHQHGLLKSTTPLEQSREAQKLINDYGFLVDQNVLAPSHMAFDVYPNLSVSYANAYGRFSVFDNLCGYSFAAVGPTNEAEAQRKEMLETMWAYGSGIPPAGQVTIVYNEAANGPIKHVAAVSKSTGLPDMGLDGQLCVRSLVMGRDAVTGRPLTGERAAQSERVRRGIEEMRNTAKLRGIPTIVVDGRADPILPPNHNSRAYLAKNKAVEGGESPTYYYELLNVQHLDAFNQFPGFQERYVPIFWYMTRAADLLWEHLTTGAPLPPSQVVRPTPRKPGEQLEERHLTPIRSSPGADAIVWSGRELRIPD